MNTMLPGYRLNPKRVKERVEASGLDLDLLANGVGWKRPYLRRAMRGDYSVSRHRLELLCLLLRCEPNDVVQGTKEQQDRANRIHVERHWGSEVAEAMLGKLDMGS